MYSPQPSHQPQQQYSPPHHPRPSSPTSHLPLVSRPSSPRHSQLSPRRRASPDSHYHQQQQQQQQQHYPQHDSQYGIDVVPSNSVSPTSSYYTLAQLAASQQQHHAANGGGDDDAFLRADDEEVTSMWLATAGATSPIAPTYHDYSSSDDATTYSHLDFDPFYPAGAITINSRPTSRANSPPQSPVIMSTQAPFQDAFAYQRHQQPHEEVQNHRNGNGGPHSASSSTRNSPGSPSKSIRHGVPPHAILDISAAATACLPVTAVSFSCCPLLIRRAMSKVSSARSCAFIALALLLVCVSFLTPPSSFSNSSRFSLAHFRASNHERHAKGHTLHDPGGMSATELLLDPAKLSIARDWSIHNSDANRLALGGDDKKKAVDSQLRHHLHLRERVEFVRARDRYLADANTPDSEVNTAVIRRRVEFLAQAVLFTAGQHKHGGVHEMDPEFPLDGAASRGHRDDGGAAPPVSVRIIPASSLSDLDDDLYAPPRTSIITKERPLSSDEIDIDNELLLNFTESLIDSMHETWKSSLPKDKLKEREKEKDAKEKEKLEKEKAAADAKAAAAAAAKK